ncbi:Na(+)-translocating NADH-quinone reductase subunit B [Providencia rustigianii]|nr:Na(+)-translocating NADH-quinone reductase subunit B [Providencia rustigianii]
MGLKNLFEKYEHHFEPGGKLVKLYPLYEAVVTVFLYSGHRHKRSFTRSRHNRSQAHDDFSLACGFPSYVLGNV